MARRGTGLARKLASYAATLALGSVINVVTIPIIIREVGAGLWAQLAVAQSIGTVVSLVAAAGWGLTGPAEIVRLDRTGRGRHYLESTWARSYLFLLVLVPAIVALVLLQPQIFWLGLVMMTGVGLASMGASWYFIGEGSPGRLFWIDLVPRVVATIVGVLLLVLTHDVWWYVAAFALGAAVTVVIPILTIPRRTGVDLHAVPVGPRAAAALLRQQRPALVAASSTAAQINIPIVLVSAVAPGALIEYALAEKVYKFAQNALSPVVQVVQGWRVEFGLAEHRRALKLILLAVTGLGLVLGTGLAVLLPLASGYLSAGRIAVTWSVSIAFGAGLATVTVSRVVSYAFLMALGARREVARGSFVSTVVGLPAVALFAFWGGASGAAWALTVSELAALVYQLLVLRARLRSTPLMDAVEAIGALQE